MTPCSFMALGQHWCRLWLGAIRHQAITWTNADFLPFRPPGTYFSEISFKILTFSFKKMHLKMSSAKWRPFCSGFIVLSMSRHAPKSIDKAVNTSQAALSGTIFCGACAKVWPYHWYHISLPLWKWHSWHQLWHNYWHQCWRLREVLLSKNKTVNRNLEMLWTTKIRYPVWLYCDEYFKPLNKYLPQASINCFAIVIVSLYHCCSIFCVTWCLKS